MRIFRLLSDDGCDRTSDTTDLHLSVKLVKSADNALISPGRAGCALGQRSRCLRDFPVLPLPRLCEGRITIEAPWQSTSPYSVYVLAAAVGGSGGLAIPGLGAFIAARPIMAALAGIKFCLACRKKSVRTFLESSTSYLLLCVGFDRRARSYKFDYFHSMKDCRRSERECPMEKASVRHFLICSVSAA